MSDREILSKSINLDNTCLSREEKEEFMNMLYKYKDAFSMRDKLGTCPNILNQNFQGNQKKMQKHIYSSSD